MKSNYIIKFELPDTSWWTKMWCRHDWGTYWKNIHELDGATTSTQQPVCRLCGKEKK